MSAAEGREALSPHAPIRVLVVDDDDLFRVGLVSLLRSQRDIDVVGQASGGRAGVRLACDIQPDVVVIDVRMAGLAGAEAMQMIVERCSSVRVLALSVSAHREDVTRAVRAGATGYLLKDAPVDDIAAAVRAAADGATWLSAAAAELVLGMFRESPSGERPSVDELSPRELDVLRLLARGMENAQIAAMLDISPRTTKNHVSRILSKLGLPNRLMAAIYAVRRGLV